MQSTRQYGIPTQQIAQALTGGQPSTGPMPPHGGIPQAPNSGMMKAPPSTGVMPPHGGGMAPPAAPGPMPGQMGGAGALGPEASMGGPPVGMPGQGPDLNALLQQLGRRGRM